MVTPHDHGSAEYEWPELEHPPLSRTEAAIGAAFCLVCLGGVIGWIAHGVFR